MATTIKIEGGGHTVELSGDGDVVYVVDLAKQAWHDTKPDRSELQTGFASQSTERSQSSNLPRGGGFYNREAVQA